MSPAYAVPEEPDDRYDTELGHDPRTPLTIVAGGLAPIAAAVIYGAAVGVRDLQLLLVLVGVAVVLTAIASWLIYQRTAGARSRSDGVSFEVAAAVITPPLTIAYALWALERPSVVLGLIVVLPLVSGSYVLPRRGRLGLQFYAVAVWSSGLLWVGTNGVIILGHAVGGIALCLISGRIADRQRRRRARERDSRERAEALSRLLTSVQQVNSLEPRAVLGAVIEGLRSLGLVDAEVREVDEVAGVARLVAGSTGLDVDIEEEASLDLPLLREALGGSDMVVIEDATTDPRVTQHVGYRSGAILPLSLGGGGRGLLSAATSRGKVTELQLEAMRMLADHAAQALERANVYAADLRIVEDLRRLDVRTQDFVSTASHELRTPLTVISGLGQTLQQRWDGLGVDRREDLLQRIDANAERLGTIVRSLLDTSAFDRGELLPTMEGVPLRPMLVRLLDRLATVTAAYPVEIGVADDLEVEVDAALIEHVLENLLGNVAKHTPQGTRVEVSAVPEGERVRIVVTDHGPGIGAEDLPHVLDRFYRGGEPNRRPSGGLGLGLALSAQIVRIHGGELEVYSQLGEGTTFAFTVPSVSTRS